MPAAARAKAILTSGGGGGSGSGKKCPHLSPVSQLFLGMGENSPDIYAIMRLRGRASVDEVAGAMQQLVDAHDRFRMRVVYRGSAWCTEVRRWMACAWLRAWLHGVMGWGGAEAEVGSGGGGGSEGAATTSVGFGRRQLSRARPTHQPTRQPPTKKPNPQPPDRRRL
jgi:hypothetical protein